MGIQPPKIVVIGAGSAIFGLGALSTMMQSNDLHGAHLALCDINGDALKTIGALANKMNAAWSADMTITSSTDRRELLADADFVIVSIQVGPREDVWEQDWRIPLRHGVRQPYAENGGPGSFAHMARSIPVMLDIAQDMEALCPDAYLLNLVNPLIRLTTAIHRYTNIKVVGLCHQLLWAYAMAGAVLSDRFGIEVPDGFHVHTDAENMQHFIPVAREAVNVLEIKSAGINHFSWVYEIRDKQTGEDLYPELRDKWFNDYPDFEPLSREIFSIYGMMPTAGDSHLCEFLQVVSDPITKPWEKYDLKLQSWQGNRKRRATRMKLAQDIVAGREDVNILRNVWGLEMLDEGISEMITAAHYNRQHYHQQFNIPNQGFIPNLPDNAIVEVPGIISAMGFQGVNFPALPEPIAELCRRELALSELYVQAAVEGDRQKALQAMLMDPMIRDIDVARNILDDLLQEFAEYLPQFNTDTDAMLTFASA